MRTHRHADPSPSSTCVQFTRRTSGRGGRERSLFVRPCHGGSVFVGTGLSRTDRNSGLPDALCLQGTTLIVTRVRVRLNHLYTCNGMGHKSPDNVCRRINHQCPMTRAPYSYSTLPGSRETPPVGIDSQTPRHWLKGVLQRRRLTILVMACLIVVPALSTSFRVSPLVMHTLSAACTLHPSSFDGAYMARGMLFRRVVRTPFASV